MPRLQISKPAGWVLLLDEAFSSIRTPSTPYISCSTTNGTAAPYFLSSSSASLTSRPTRPAPPSLAYSRIHHRLEIEPLVPDDTAEYLRLRLHQAGCDREVFASDAIALLHEAIAGAMRDLDRLAAAALREAARKKRKLVERDAVTRIIEADTRERDR
jgi:hypothetical protein